MNFKNLTRYNLILENLEKDTSANLRRLSITVERPEMELREVYGWGSPRSFLTNTLDWSLLGKSVLTCTVSQL